MKLAALLKSKKFLKVLIVISLFFAAFWVAYFSKNLSKGVSQKADLSFNEAEVMAPKEGGAGYENIVSVAFLGQGGEGHPGGNLTDSIIVLAVDTQNKSATFISVPRDLWVPVPYDWERTQNYKINAAYLVGADNVRYANKKPELKGGGNMTKHVLENVTGLPISYFAAIDFESYIDLIDALGGIEVNVPKAFTDNFYPVKGLENETCGLTGEQIAEAHAKYSGFELEKQFTCRWETVSYEKGPANLTGEEALKFVRSRHGDSDFGRSERQFAVLEGIGEKLLSRQAFSNSFDVTEELSGLVRTDINLDTVKKLLSVAGNPEEYKISSIHITEENLVSASKSADGQFILIPKAGSNNFEGIKKYIRERI